MPARTGGPLDNPALWVGTMAGVVDACRLVIDRPRSGDSHGLMYVAEPEQAHTKATIAASHVFYPEDDLTADRAARAEIESLLLSQGWQCDTFGPRGLIGVRFVRSSRQ
jgi:hypothetical protein